MAKDIAPWRKQCPLVVPWMNILILCIFGGKDKKGAPDAYFDIIHSKLVAYERDYHQLKELLSFWSLPVGSGNSDEADFSELVSI
jgi:hypothetical protein